MYKKGQDIIRQTQSSGLSLLQDLERKILLYFIPYLNMTITLINVAAFDLMLLCLRNNTLILLIWPLIGFNFINFQLHVCIPCCFSRKQTHIQSILI